MRTLARRTVLVLVFFGVSVLMGCATSADLNYMSNSTLLVYEKTMRWGDFKSALGFRRTADIDPSVLPADYESIEVGGYTSRDLVRSADNKQLTQVVEIHYFRSDEARVHKVIDKQSWEYDDALKRWVITSPFPEFK